jgi:hypothetical protein
MRRGCARGVEKSRYGHSLARLYVWLVVKLRSVYTPQLFSRRGGLCVAHMQTQMALKAILVMLCFSCTNIIEFNFHHWFCITIGYFTSNEQSD